MRDVRRRAVLYMRPYVPKCARYDALVVGGAFHGVRLPSACLTVREDAAIEAVQYGSNERTDLDKNQKQISQIFPIHFQRTDYFPCS